MHLDSNKNWWMIHRFPRFWIWQQQAQMVVSWLVSFDNTLWQKSYDVYCHVQKRPVGGVGAGQSGRQARLSDCIYVRVWQSFCFGGEVCGAIRQVFAPQQSLTWQAQARWNKHSFNADDNRGDSLRPPDMQTDWRSRWWCNMVVNIIYDCLLTGFLSLLSTLSLQEDCLHFLHCLLFTGPILLFSNF